MKLMFTLGVRKTALIVAFPLLACCALASPRGETPLVEALIATHANSMGPMKLPGISIKNFGVVDGRIFRGAQPKEEDYAAIAAIGVTTLVDLRDDAETYARGAAEAAGLRYINIRLNSRRSPTDEEVLRFLAVLADPATRLTYVHCAGGRHRTGSMIALYRLTANGWSAEQAYREMKAYDYYSRHGHGCHKDYVFEYYRRMQADPASVPVRPQSPVPRRPSTRNSPVANAVDSASRGHGVGI